MEKKDILKEKDMEQVNGGYDSPQIKEDEQKIIPGKPSHGLPDGYIII